VFSFLARVASWSECRLSGRDSANYGRLAASILSTFLLLLGCTAYSQTKASADNFVALSKRAGAARDADQLQEAVLLYTQALALRPRWEEGWWSLGTLQYDQDHYAKAATAFRKAIALNGANGTAHAMLGLCEFELGKDALALINLLQAEHLGIVNNDDLRKVALYHLGILELRAHRFGDAQDSLRQVAKQKVRTRDLTIALGQAALLVAPQNSSIQPSESENVIEPAGEAEALAAVQEFDQAKQIYQSLISRFPDYPNLHFAFGRLLLDAHETDEAVTEFQRELERDPQNVNSMLEIASVRYQVDSENGLKYAESAAKLAPEKPFAHYMLGLLRLDTGNASGAIPELEIAQKSFPQQSKVYFALGNAYARVGRKADAAKARTEFLRLDKKATDADDANVYGAMPVGPSEGQLRPENRQASPP
jgi:tetratricopeptide (TPR) repeat protein